MARGLWVRRGNGDSHIATERVEKAKQPIAGKPVKATVQQSGYLGLGKAQEFAGRLLGETSFLHDFQNLGSQFGFRQVLFGIRNAQIGKHVAAAAMNRFFRHSLLRSQYLLVLFGGKLESPLDDIDVGFRRCDALFGFFWNAWRTKTIPANLTV
jgi:hypothetical protein